MAPAPPADLRAFIDGMDQGVVIGRLEHDAAGAPRDIVITTENPAAARILGRSLTGHALSAIDPRGLPLWRDLWARVLATGQGERRELHVASLGIWLDIFVLPLGPPRRQRVAAVFRDITDSRQVAEALRSSEERLRMAMDAGNLATWDWAMDRGEITWSDSHYRMMGYGVGAVRPSYDAWISRVHPDDRAATEAALQRARDSRTPYSHHFRTLHPDGTVRWCYGRGTFLYDDRGRPVRMIGVMEDTTERRRWEETLRVMVEELHHRGRNLLALVSSIANQTLTASSGLDDFSLRFGDRLEALSRVQDLLARPDRAAVTIGGLLRMEMDALGTDGEALVVDLDGPEVALPETVVQTLTLALHELATNARKYGALKQGAGRLRVSWTVEPAADGGRLLTLDWREEVAEPLPPPAVTDRGGYGRKLIERALPYALGARTSYRLDSSGVHCTIALPLPDGA
ncbi:sensor histidine kinase [Caenispirillum bisanense]|uniref:sensor histidine kinase n=1 Tax=Caenispirillum bisanense TaxID=414052 RepID=UPI0031CF4E06